MPLIIALAPLLSGQIHPVVLSLSPLSYQLSHDLRVLSQRVVESERRLAKIYDGCNGNLPAVTFLKDWRDQDNPVHSGREDASQ